MIVDKKHCIPAILLSGVMAGMYLFGIPFCFMGTFPLWDITPGIITIFLSILFILTTGLWVIYRFLPDFMPAISRQDFTDGMKKYGISCLLVTLIPAAGFCIGYYPFDRTPSIGRVLVEGVLYYVAVGAVEELIFRGLLVRALGGLFSKARHAMLWAVILAACIFGIGHFFGMLGQDIFLLLAKVVWATGLGIFLGGIYVRTHSLLLAAVFHAIIDFSGIPFCFTTQTTYPLITVFIILPTFIIAGIYGIVLICREEKNESNKGTAFPLS